MSEPKEKTPEEKHEEFEKQQAKDGIAVHLPRADESAPDKGKKKTVEK